jgi:CDP-glycerol glycerophosphotransferase (TagB/SpsB family)
MIEAARDNRSGRRILYDARTPVHYAMFAPVHAAMAGDSRVQFTFVASEEPRRSRYIFQDAGPNARLIGPARAAFEKSDAYVTSDFMWASLLFKTCRIQMFHGVGGKYGFDAPTESLRAWHRLFFVNRRRLRNCIAAGAIDAESAAIRLIGMPKVDCLVNATLERGAVLESLGLPGDRPTLLYAPTWSPASSLNVFGLELVRRLGELPVNVIVKLHDRSRDLRYQYSGGIDWPALLAPHLEPGRVLLAKGADVCPYLVAADVLVTDHSSAGFEYLLRDRPIVRIHVPELLRLARVHADYVQLLSEVSESVTSVDETMAAVERAFADPARRSATRRAVAADLFYEPGTATARCAAALYEAIELSAPAHTAIAKAPTTSSPPGRAALAAEPGQLRPRGVSCLPSA